MQHHFDIDIAKEYGILEAVLLDHLYFWIEKNKANGSNFFDGNYWTYNSMKAFGTLFPYVTERQIRTALDHLKDKGLIETGNYNKMAFDRSLWYALTEKGNCICRGSQMHLTLKSNGLDTEVKPIPYTNTYTYTDTNGNTTSSKDSVVLPMGSIEPLSDSPVGKSNAIVAEVIDYLNQKAGTAYRATTKANSSLILARHKEGATLEDFKAVIDRKCAEWLHDGRMAQYLRPKTLFAAQNFDSYLGAKSTPVKRVGASGVEYEVDADREDEFDGIF